MIYSAVRTPDLGSDLEQLADLFNRVFDKQSSAESLLQKYTAPHTGYSFHGLMKDDSRVVGALTVIPFEYSYFDETRTFGNAIDLMIDPEGRGDMFSFKKIYDAVMALVGDNVDLVYAVPNSNSYLYFKKLLKWHDIGDLYYYILPSNVGSIKPRFWFLNPFTRLGSFLLSTLPGTANSIPVSRGIHKVRSEPFNSYRFAHNYQLGEVGETCFYYRVFQEDATQVCYIVDIDPVSPRSLDAATSYIRRTTKCDAIMYIDIVKMNPHKSVRVPRTWEPRNLHLVAKIVTDRVDSRVLDAASWQFNLADFDVR